MGLRASRLPIPLPPSSPHDPDGGEGKTMSGEANPPLAAPAPAEKPRAAPAPRSPAGTKRATYKERRELEAIEARIAALEAAQMALGQELNAPGKPYSAFQELAEKLAQTGAELDAAMERWAELAELVAE